MAEIDTGLNNLWWIQKPHWLDTTDSSEKGTRMAQWGAEMTQRDEQQRRQYALQLSQLDLRKREGDVQMQGQVLDQQLKRLQLADVGELQKGYTALQAGQDYDPKLVTHTAALTWQNAKADNDLAAARSAAQAARNKRAAETILEVPESEEFIFPEPGKVNGEALARWSAIADQQKETRTLRLRTAAPEIAAQSKLDVEAMRESNTTGEGGARTAVPVTLPDGNTDPNHVMVWTGRTYHTLSVHDKNAMAALTVPQRQAAIRTLLNSAQKKLTLDSTDAQAKADVTKYEAMMSGMLTPTNKSSNGAPAVGEIRRGYKFIGGDPADPASWQKQ